MDTREMIDKVKKDVSAFLSKVASRTEVTAKISKLRLEISRKNSDIKAEYQKLGEYVYNNKENFEGDAFLADEFGIIDKLNEENKIAEKTIEELREATKEKHSGDDKPSQD
ncbi:MAG: hypothetical protein ACP5EQ_04925 [Candidatus Cloacimonadia bacterium]